MTIFGSMSMAFLSYASYKQDLRKNPGLSNHSFFDIISLPSTMLTQKVYYIALGGSFVISIVAFVILYGFCEEMSQFEFQPDQ